MREILFRAKRKNWRDLPKEEWWVEGYPVKYQPCASKDEYVYGIVPTYASALYIIEIAPETLCQYTGLKDKDGNRIWENDILELENGAKLRVSWHTFKASWVISKKGWMYNHFFGEGVEPEDVKVIGNIFDNQELLERS